MRDLSAGPRVLLKRLRELMAEPLEPQERLDRIVRQIAQNMVAEVCSVYVLRSDGVLELYAKKIKKVMKSLKERRDKGNRETKMREIKKKKI